MGRPHKDMFVWEKMKANKLTFRLALAIFFDWMASFQDKPFLSKVLNLTRKACYMLVLGTCSNEWLQATHSIC